MPKSPEELKGYNKQKKREERERRKAAGLCVVGHEGCAKEARPGQTTCANCSEKNTETRNVSRERQREAS